MFEHYPVERFRRSLDANVTGTFLACQVLGTPMAQRGQGSIINVASTYGLVARITDHPADEQLHANALLPEFRSSAAARSRSS